MMVPRAAMAPLLVGVALTACAGASSPGADYVADYEAQPEVGLIHVVVEIPAGTNDKWEVDKATGRLEWERVEGQPRVVRYLAYPGNYGMIPRTRLPRERGGDGDPLDVVLLGPAVPRGSVVSARPIGVLKLTDDGERDDKILAVATDGPFEGLDAHYPGVRHIIETWFTNYKGTGRLSSAGFEGRAAAMAVIAEASRYYEEGEMR